MVIWKNYLIPHSLPDALKALVSASGETRLIAGGTDLLLDLQQGRLPPVETLIDISQIPEMNLIERREDSIFIGSAVPLNHLLSSPLIKRNAQALMDAVSLIGGPQVRNTATLGGNIVHALPAADGAIALLSLAAQAEVASQEGRRLVPVEELFLGPGKSALDHKHEILVGFFITPKKQGQGSAFRRVMRPQGVAIAILNFAVWVESDRLKIRNIRISCGPAGPTPFRARLTEKQLCGQVLDQKLLQSGIESFLTEARFRTSPHRATEAYRRYLAGILFNETFQEAWERAKKPVGTDYD